MASKGKKPIRRTTTRRRKGIKNPSPPCSISSDVTSTSLSTSISSTSTSTSTIPASGCCTPISKKSRIPEMLTCPPAPKKQKIIEHIVLFKVKDDVDSDKIDAMVNDLNSLATIDQVLYISASPIHRLRSASAFTHVLHSRYRSKEDLSAYVAHPDHLRVVEATMPIWEDIMSVDWIADHVPRVLKSPGGSVAKVTLLKLKENVTDETKKEIMEVVKEESREISVGENFSPARAKGFSIGSVAYFKDLGEVEAHEELVKEKVGGYVEDTIVVEFVVPPSS